MAVEDFNRLHMDLLGEFDRYVRENPGFAARIPYGAIVVLQLEGNDEFNRWSHGIAERNRALDKKDKDRPLLFVRVKGLRPEKSRLIRPVIARTA
jgi:hypothetical protein